MADSFVKKSKISKREFLNKEFHVSNQTKTIKKLNNLFGNREVAKEQIETANLFLQGRKRK